VGLGFSSHLQSFLLYLSQFLPLLDFSIPPSSFYGWKDFLVSEITPEVDEIIPVLVQVSEDNQLESKASFCITVPCQKFSNQKTFSGNSTFVSLSDRSLESVLISIHWS
jgi:hypothetical protein